MVDTLDEKTLEEIQDYEDGLTSEPEVIAESYSTGELNTPKRRQDFVRYNPGAVNQRLNDDVAKRLSRVYINSARKRRRNDEARIAMVESPDNLEARLSRRAAPGVEVLGDNDLPVELWDPVKHPYINGNLLVDSDLALLKKATSLFTPVKMGTNYYLVSKNLYEMHISELQDKLGNPERFSAALEELAVHPDVKIEIKRERLERSNATINVVYEHSAELERFPQAERPHVSLLASNAFESLGTGEGSRFSDSFVKGFGRYHDNLPIPQQNSSQVGDSEGITITDHLTRLDEIGEETPEAMVRRLKFQGKIKQ